jgi:DHA2 family multidrug resistance protein
MSGWLSAYFGRKRHLTGSILLFVVASFFCGAAIARRSDLLARGARNRRGALLSTAQTLFEAFPPHEVGIGQAMFGVGVMVGPTLGQRSAVDRRQLQLAVDLLHQRAAGIIAALMTMAYVHDAEHQERAGDRRDRLSVARDMRGLVAVHAREGRAV